MVPDERATQTGAEPAVPTQVAGYTIVSEIGRGGMGIVYRAHDPKLGRELALKRPKSEYAARHDFADRFLREARAASRLMHPNITAVFAAFDDHGVPWLAMELVEGGSLRQRLRDGAPLTITEILIHAEGLTDALRAAHEAGILHTDINPNNILLGKDGRARLTDFGLARAKNAPGEQPLFDDGAIPGWSSAETAGTRGYMAPEQVKGEPLDQRSDLYSLGLVLYEMCTGRPVFGGATTIEWVGAVIEGRTEALARLGPETRTPPELARIVGKATATDRRDRYASAGAMLEDLRALRRYTDSGVEMAVADAARARKRTTYGVLAAIVLVAAAGLWALLRPQPGPGTLQAKPITSAPGWEGQPALSPDGSVVAYASNETGNADIWVIPATGGDAVRLTDDPAADTHPAWFPDGASLAFASDRSREPSIWTVGATGGTARLLIARAEDPAVSPDGKRLAFALRDASGVLRIAVAAFADPGAVKVLTGPNGGALDHRNPAWSPDGQRICYQALRDLWVVPSNGGMASMLTDRKEGSWDPAWSADGRFVYFSSNRSGPQAIWRIAAGGGPPERVTLGTGPEVQPSLSRDGTRIAYATRREDQDIEVRDRMAARSWRVASSASDSSPACAPDGSALVFQSRRLGTSDLFLQRIGAAGPDGQPRRLTELSGTVGVPAFSRDGLWIAFHRVVNGERDIWIMPSAGGEPYNLTGRPGLDVHPAFSPDGKSMAFVSDRAGGQHVWVADFGNGRLVSEPWQATSGEGIDWCPSWSPDGRRLAFNRQAGTDSDTLVVEIDGAAPARRITHGTWVEWLRWGLDPGALLVAAHWDRRHLEVRRVSLETGASEAENPPIVLGDTGFPRGFDTSADGRVIAFESATPTGDVWVAEGLPGAR